MSNFTFTPSSNGASAGPLGSRKNLKFTPAVSVIEGKRAKQKFKEYKLTWWEPESFFQYDAMLCSAFYGMADQTYYRDEYNIPKDFLLIADSGGFEQATQGVRIEAIDVFRWQTRNADIAFTLDIPPINKESMQFTNDMTTFRKCAEQSYRNAECVLSNIDNSSVCFNPDIKIYTVLQGHTLEQLHAWTQGNLTDFDGLALSHKSPRLVWLAVQAMYAKEQGVEKIHALTGTGFNSVPIIAYLQKHFKTVTFDSSSYGMGARNMQYNLPDRFKLFFGRAYNGKIKKLPCDCPICSNVTIDDFQTGKSISGALISLHNLYTYIRHVNFIDAIVKDDEMFASYIKKFTNPKTQEAIEFIKSCEEIGFEDAYKKANLLEPMYKQVSFQDMF